MKDIIKRIITNHGYITKADLPELVKECPGLPVVIKWGCREREIVLLQHVETKIHNVLKNNLNEYVREMFLSANQLDTLRAIM